MTGATSKIVSPCFRVCRISPHFILVTRSLHILFSCFSIHSHTHTHNKPNTENGTCKPTTFSVIHLLLPIVLRFINENFTHKYAELRSAAYEVLPVLGRCLTWKKYLSSISNLLRTSSGPKNAGGFDTASRDRARIQGVCALLDAFDGFEQNQDVLKSLEQKLLPLMLSKLLIKKNEDDQEQVNVPIALAMIKF